MRTAKGLRLREPEFTKLNLRQAPNLVRLRLGGVELLVACVLKLRLHLGRGAQHLERWLVCICQLDPVTCYRAVAGAVRDRQYRRPWRGARVSTVSWFQLAVSAHQLKQALE